MVLASQKMNAETVAETQQPDVLTLELVTMMQQHLVMMLLVTLALAPVVQILQPVTIYQMLLLTTAHVNLIHALVVQIRQLVTMIQLQR
jgi:hypothetical protein